MQEEYDNYGIKDLLKNERVRNYFSKRIDIILKSVRKSKFLFFLQCINLILALYIIYQFVVLISNIVNYLDNGMTDNFVILALVFFLFFTLTVLTAIFNFGVSGMKLFTTKLDLTLLLMLIFMAVIGLNHFFNEKIKNVSKSKYG